MQFKVQQPLNQAKLRQFLKEEDEFVTKLLHFLPATQNADDEEEDEITERSNGMKPIFSKTNQSTKRSLGELMEKMQNKTNKINQPKDMKRNQRISYKEKLQLKAMRAKMKKTTKQLERKNKIQYNKDREDNVKELLQLTKESPPPTQAQSKVIYTKIDFRSDTIAKSNKKPKKGLQVTLKELIDNRNQIETLKKEGNITEAVDKQTTQRVKSALRRAQGEKVKDDVKLLKQSISKRQQEKKQSQKQWQARLEHVEKQKNEKQQKREGNLNKRKKEKKTKKTNIAIKRGRVFLD